MDSKLPGEPKREQAGHECRHGWKEHVGPEQQGCLLDRQEEANGRQKHHEAAPDYQLIAAVPVVIKGVREGNSGHAGVGFGNLQTQMMKI